MNIIEIDAASNNSVEGVRAVIDGLEYPPSEGRYKVYIIDEVHMLSGQAFNALLKSLEEPPAYVIFILATTEIHKVPITIRSRCQRYDFKRMNLETIVARMQELLVDDHHEVEEKGLGYIARRADGSMRDALSLLDQCISFYPNGVLTYDQILSVLGAVDTQLFSELLKGIIAQDVVGVMHTIEEVVMAGRELQQFVIDFIWYLRNLMLLKSDTDMEDMLDVSSENLADLKEQSSQVEMAVIMRYIHILSELLTEFRLATQKRALLEVALIRLMRPQMDEDYAAIIDRLVNLENAVAGGVVLSSPGVGDGMQREAVTVEPFPEAVEEDVKQACAMWPQIIRDAEPALTGFLRAGGHPTVTPDGKGVMLVFDDENGVQVTAYRQLSQPEYKQRVEDLVSAHVNAKVPVQLKLDTSPLDRAHKYTDAVEKFSAELGMTIDIEE